MSEHLWFIIIRQKKKGPFTVSDLKKETELTPDTLAWREGMLAWTPIRDIPELAVLFEDSSYPKAEEGEIASLFGGSAEGAALTLTPADPPWRFWVIFFTLILAYALFQMFSAG